MAKFKVLRPHLGDRWYEGGDTRTAKPAEVAHLVKTGVLERLEDDEAENDDEPELTAIQRNLQPAPPAKVIDQIDFEDAIANAVAAARFAFEDEKASAVAQAVADAETAARQHHERLSQELSALKAKTEEDSNRKYVIGNLTSEHVFKAAGLENLSDIQAVLDAVEVALSANVEQMPPVEGQKTEAEDKTKVEPATKDKAEPKAKDKAAG